MAAKFGPSCRSQLRSLLIQRVRLLQHPVDYRSRLRNRCESPRPALFSVFPARVCRWCAPATRPCFPRARHLHQFRAGASIRLRNPIRRANRRIAADRLRARKPQNQEHSRSARAELLVPSVAPNLRETNARRHKRYAPVGVGLFRRGRCLTTRRYSRVVF